MISKNIVNLTAIGVILLINIKRRITVLTFNNYWGFYFYIII